MHIIQYIVKEWNAFEAWLKALVEHHQKHGTLPDPSILPGVNSPNNTVGDAVQRPVVASDAEQAHAAVQAKVAADTGSEDRYPNETIHSQLVALGTLDKEIDAFEADLQPGEYIGPKPGTNSNSNPVRDLMQVHGPKAKQANDYSYKHSSLCLNIQIKQRALKLLPVSSLASLDAAARSGNYSDIPGADTK